jgi:hypothetical protein
MEIQLTDFENAAFVVFVVLLSRVILGLELNMYIPISKLDENMGRAQKRDAVLKEKFWFRSNLFPPDIITPSTEVDPEIEEMSVYEILCGKGGTFPGLIPLCKTYLDFIGCDSITRTHVDKYLTFLCERASGKLMTNAAWIRQYIQTHPDYCQDSRIPHTTAYDLLIACKEIGEGLRHEPRLIGEDNRIPVIRPGMNPFQSSKNQHTTDRDLMSAARTACRQIGEQCGNNPPRKSCRQVLLKTYIQRAMEKRERSANELLQTKIDEMEKLKDEIDKIVESIDMIRTSSERIEITVSRSNSPTDLATQA